MSSFLEWLGVSGVLAMIGAAVSHGKNQAELKDLRARVSGMTQVAETVIRIEERSNAMARDLIEIKGEIKQLISRPSGRSRKPVDE